jgi:hypothetical protein
MWGLRCGVSDAATTAVVAASAEEEDDDDDEQQEDEHGGAVPAGRRVETAFSGRGGVGSVTGRG